MSRMVKVISVVPALLTVLMQIAEALKKEPPVPAKD